MASSREPAQLLMPKKTLTEHGRERRVGVEIELSGLSYAQLIETVSRFFGQPAYEQARYEQRIATEFGDFIVELDADPIKQLDLHNSELPEPLASLSELTGDLIDSTAEHIVPLEVICPPIYLSRLGIIERLCVRLREQGAMGSRHAIWYAFGLQLNPELPALNATTILNYLRAFAGLYDWFKGRRQLDISRKLTTYIAPYPAAYLHMLMNPNYAPHLDQLIADYMDYNPTRNRALDLMPLFMYLDQDMVRARVRDPRIKARPTLHVRLPDCDIDNPEWHFADVWNDWVQVDDLANDPELLRAMCECYRSRHDSSMASLFRNWTRESGQFLPHPGLASRSAPGPGGKGRI